MNEEEEEEGEEEEEEEEEAEEEEAGEGEGKTRCCGLIKEAEEEPEPAFVSYPVFKEQNGLGDEDEEDTEYWKLKKRLLYARKKFFGLLIACVVFQLSLSMFILIDARANGELGFTEAPAIEIGFCRFVAGMVMHVIINDEIFNGLKMIKYSVNHPWKFSSPAMAFATGFLQVIAMVLISLINYAVIAASGTVLDIAKDFTALMIIADFDDIFGAGMEAEKARVVC